MKKIILLLFILIFSTSFFAGCWDSKGLNTLFLITGFGIDTEENGDYTVTVQIAKPTQTSVSSQSSSSESEEFRNISQSGISVFDAFSKMARNSSRFLLMDHNQVLLFSEDMAIKGIKQQLDMFVRITDSRIETPVFITEAGIQDIFNAKFSQEKLASNYLYEAIELFSKRSNISRVRVLDIINNFADDHHSMAIPIITLKKNNEKDILEFNGMAVLKDGKMVGKLSVDEALGYVITDKKVRGYTIRAQTDEGIASYHISSSKCKQKVKLEGNQIIYEFDLNQKLELQEVIGFTDYSAVEMLKKLEKVAEDAIKEKIQSSINMSKTLNVDFYNVCCALKRHYYKFWETVIDDWDEKYQDVKFVVNAKIKIPDTGDIIQSIELKELETKEEVLNG